MANEKGQRRRANRFGKQKAKPGVHCSVLASSSVLVPRFTAEQRGNVNRGQASGGMGSGIGWHLKASPLIPELRPAPDLRECELP